MNLTKTAARAAAGLFATAGLGMVLVGLSMSPAAATDDNDKKPPKLPPPPITRCQDVWHTNTDGITLTAGGKADLTPDGVVLTTTVNADKVGWKYDLGKVAMKDITKLSYVTRKLDDGSINAAALPAYHVYLTDTSGPNSDTTLVFEPYYQISGNPPVNTTQTWDVLAGKFWASKTVGGIMAEPGGSYAGNRTWAQIKSANPYAKVVAIGFGQGTYNAGTKGLLNHVQVATKEKCVDHIWKKKHDNDTTATATATATTTATATATATATTVPVDDGKPRLPQTGAPVGILVAGGTGLTAAGAGLLLLVARRRRGEFVA